MKIRGLKSVKRSSPRGSGLRDEPRDRAIAVAGVVVQVRAESDRAVDENEERGEGEAISGTRIIELIARAIEPQIDEVLEPLRIRKEHCADILSPFAELALHVHDGLAALAMC